MNTLTKLMCGFFPFLIISCNKDESLSPPENNKFVGVYVNSESEINVLPVNVMYRSNICSIEKYDSKGRRYKEDGYNSTQQDVKNIGSISNVSIPVDGGGDCKWKLSNITVQLMYDKNKFDKKINASIKNSIILVFDDNLPQNFNSNIEAISSQSVKIRREYFPWIDTDFMDTHGKSVSLIMLGDRNLYSYNVKDASTVNINVISNFKKIVYSEGPKGKSKNEKNYTVFKYPDGTIDTQGKDFPDFKKLQSISKSSD
ncbi:hypothetical protein ACI49Z_004440 [Cronobacter turicensis]|uniref:hypothetical protein n=1 Tax=Cronobacter turicensis TaxID=413502 RepID=UPI0024AD8E3B|nr:hypothetical protein [Cronobacter turicensis]ELY6318968.1 hypothetical protein [Cronobacter turicensis]MDI6431514.1 hypothetical protein [Cronobacter turicensis]